MGGNEGVRELADLPEGLTLNGEDATSRGVLTTSTATKGQAGTGSASQVTTTPTEISRELPTTYLTTSLSSDPPLPSSFLPPLEPSPRVLLDLPVVEELPLTEVRPAPELLSFNEWRERYALAADPSVMRRAKKAAQRDRQDFVGASTSEMSGATYDGDGADLGSLFSGGDDAGVSQDSGSGLGGEVGAVDVIGADAVAVAPTSDMANPIQPLPDVGTSESNDPLLLLKDRSNYAAFECAAMVHRSSRQSKGASAILVEKKDRYMLTPCSANPKFVDVELCDEIQIDTLILANFEFFSSTFKHFKASCSVDYPGKPADWHNLGTFRARNVRGIQVFKPIRNPHFCRYLRIDFLSHFGSEFYCPVSLLRVYGYTQLDAYRESERKAKAIEEALAAAELIEEEITQYEPVLDDALRVEVDELKRLDDMGLNTVNATLEITALSSLDPSTVDSGAASASYSSASSWNICPTTTRMVTPPRSVAQELPLPTAHAEEPQPASTLSSTTTASAAGPTSFESSTRTKSSPSSPWTAISSVDETVSTSTATPEAVESTAEPGSTGSRAAAQSESSQSSTARSPPSTSSSYSAASPAEASSSSNASVTSATPTSSNGRPITPSDIPVIVSRPAPAPRNDTQSATQPHVPLPPPPRPPVIQPTQPGESIYGTIMKRLTSLEHNQTLAMHFIEAQSSMLREAFGRIERRLTDIEGSRGRQEQSIRQALLDLEQQRVGLERERLALSTQVSMLTQEVRLEKRLTVAQLIGLLLLVIFVGFTRGIPTSPFLHLASMHLDTKRESKRTQADLLADRLDAAAAPRRGHRISPSVSLSRYNGSSSTFKRYPSIPKAGPRRHYGIGLSKVSNGKGDPGRARPWSPPTRHASAPPEEPPAMMRDSKAKRRRPLADLAGSDRHAFEFPTRFSSTQPGSISRTVSDIATDGPVNGLAGSSVSLPPIPFPSSSLSAPALPSDVPHQHLDLPVNLGYLSTSVGPPADRSNSTFSPASTNGFVGDDERDEGGYHTYSSDEDAIASVFPSRTPSRDRLRAAALASSSPSSPVTTASPRIRPPKPHIPLRPATSMGFRDERLTQKDKTKRTSRGADATQAANGDDLPSLGPAPTTSTPSPPPETFAASSHVQHKRSDTLT
ncbi:hypothetical protein JCM10295v2_006114 [Rhodotorula toruloides]